MGMGKHEIFINVMILIAFLIWSMLHHGSVGRVQNNYVYMYFFGIFVVGFHQKICVFIIFISFFDEVSNFCNRNIKQSETGIGDKKLSVELHVTME